MKLREAYLLADRIKGELAPMCERIEIAGSIRRARPEVNDIDLVLLPKPGMHAAIRERCLRRCDLVTDGAQNLIVRLPTNGGPASGFQVDLFFARGREQDLLGSTPGNWGSILLCRTGSKEHNIWLCQRAESMGLKWQTYKGLMGPVKLEDGTNGTHGSNEVVIASETEEEIFTALGLQMIPPVMREVGST